MAITIKEIAARAGVSIGTVDRALHHRGRVRPEIAKRIRQIALEAGFKPSRAGRALALAKNPVKIGIVVHLAKTGFMQRMLRGIADAKAALEGLGAHIDVRSIASVSATEQMAAIDELIEAGVQGIAISPAEDVALQHKIHEVIKAKGIPFVTFNTDMAMTGRMSFVGLNNLQSGKTAAGLMASLIGGRGHVAVITGHPANQACRHRVEGFVSEIRENYPDVVLCKAQHCFDDSDLAYNLTIASVANNPGLAGILICSGGQDGMCKALHQLGAASRIKVVAYDLFPATAEGLHSGAIDFLIDQDAHFQGYKPAMLLYDKLFHNDDTAQSYFYTDIIIKTKHNI